MTLFLFRWWKTKGDGNLNYEIFIGFLIGLKSLKLWTRIFHVRDSLFICEKLIFGKKLESPLILFLF